MLKLTNSFYRYLRVATDKVHVRKFAHLTRKKTCTTEWGSKLVLFHTGQVLRQKKRFRIRIPSLSANECSEVGQMSELPRPTHNHASHGGSFEISEEDHVEQWRRRSIESAKGQRVVPPDFRRWEVVRRSNSSSDGPSFKFRVMSYNVLAQCLLEQHRTLYTECEPRNLTWKVRSARIFNEITQLAPDVLCLQEVEASYVNSFYAKFEEMGYFGVYKRKTGERHDGCAIYFKQSMFFMQDHISVEFYQPRLPILNRDNVGIIVKLIPRALPRTPVVIATTHLLYNPKRTDVRLAQIQLFLAEIDRFSYYTNGKDSGHYPTILTGDLNSTSNSAVIKLLERGHVSRINPLRDVSDWKRIGVTDNCQHLSVYLNRQKGEATDFSDVQIFNSDYSKDPHEPDSDDLDESCSEFDAMFNGEVIGHSLQLMSAYNKCKSDGQREASTFQNYWLTVDYIYFSCCSALRLVERLRLPTETECEVLGSLPNDVYGSDHLALAALFELVPCKSSL
ncbi:protein angel isoform X1 [Manduca sexta]|uniref:protein angel isoform X1 n=2 Tax=Manduca sexta TaxID=7130 RepID=UPI0018900DA2|nr:protein angel isoform X1 [Manduca sexta]XP_030033114.2 protein angel isoform X1 [Manduca sexta]XP_030033115.2 protein angel isoform X1 [Manduca sexta]XP_037299858.1 protein angel isoform X1 [Manduca sexta]